MFSFVYTTIGFWAIPTLVVIILGVVMFAVHQHNQKKREEDFEEQLEEKIQAIQGELPGESEDPVNA